MFEGHPQADVTYIVARSSSGSLLGALPVYHVHAETNRHYLPSSPSCANKSSWWVFGNRRGYRSNILTASHLANAQRIEIVAALLSAALALSDGSGQFYFMPNEEVMELSQAGLVHPIQRSGAEVVFDVTNGGFDGFVSTIASKSRRDALKRERRRFLGERYTVQVVPLPEVVDELPPLLAQLENKYNLHRPLSEIQSYFKRMASATRPGKVVTARRGDQLAAYCHFYEFGVALWARTVGFDYALIGNSFAYFNVAYFELIEEAARLGLPTVHLGSGALDAKTNHGGRAVDLWKVEAVRR